MIGELIGEILLEGFLDLLTPTGRSSSPTPPPLAPAELAEWQRAADTLGGRFDPPAIRAHVDGIGVVVEKHVDGQVPETHAGVVVDEADFWLHFVPWDSRFAAEVTLGDSVFDRAMTIQTNRPNLARAWLAGDARAAVLALAHARFAVDGRLATASIPYMLDEHDTIVALAHAIVRFGRGGRDLRARWRAAAAELGARGGEALAFELPHAGGLVRIGHEAARDRTRVSLERPGAEPRELFLDTVEADLAAWREAIATLSRARGGGDDTRPYR